MNDKILFVITFTYCILVILSTIKSKKGIKYVSLLNKIFNPKNIEDKPQGYIVNVIVLIFYLAMILERILVIFSLFYQVYFWFFKIVKLEI